MNKQKGFTLTELLVVVILIGIIAAFALPNYQKAILKAHERDAVVQLTVIHAALKIYEAQTNTYPTDSTLDLTGINDRLGLNVIANGMEYEYRSNDPDHFSVTATWVDAVGNFTISVSQIAIEQDGNSPNPCCGTGVNCPSLPDC